MCVQHTNIWQTISIAKLKENYFNSMWIVSYLGECWPEEKHFCKTFPSFTMSSRRQSSLEQIMKKFIERVVSDILNEVFSQFHNHVIDLNELKTMFSYIFAIKQLGLYKLFAYDFEFSWTGHKNFSSYNFQTTIKFIYKYICQC